MPLKILPDRPLDTITVSVIRAVMRAAEEMSLPAYLVGATARIILLEHVHGMRRGRATRDLDFAFAVEEWSQFQALKQRLCSAPEFEESKTAMQRLLFRADGIGDPFLVDLIPYGGIEQRGATISWPPDTNIVLNVAGYRDAHDAASVVEISLGMIVRVASIPGIAVLKLFAWVDRGQEDPKDALDFLTICQQYTDAGNQDRVYEEALATLESVEYDIELAGAWLLGLDTARTCSEETRGKLSELFAQRRTRERLATDMSRGVRSRDDAAEYASALLRQFLNGFGHLIHEGSSWT